MKKFSIIWVLCILLLQWFGFAKTIAPNVGPLKRANLQETFAAYGFDLERNFYLISETMWLQDRWVNDGITTKIYRALKKHDVSKLVHQKCVVGEYKALWTRFYAWIGTVKPFFNTITSYQIQGEDGSRSPVYIFGSGDVDTHDNCNDEYMGKDDKPAQCARRMWTYFGTNNFKILSCKP